MRENYNSRASPFASGEVLGLRLGGVTRTVRTGQPRSQGPLSSEDPVNEVEASYEKGRKSSTDVSSVPPSGHGYSGHL